MRATADGYLDQLQQLLPPGAAWPRDPGAVLTRLLAGTAEGLARLHNRTLDLIEEADPRTALELLPDWERVCGLPGACAAAAPTTLQERRATVVAALTARGGQSVSYYYGLAQALGYQVEIVERQPFVCGASACGGTHEIGPAATRHAWRCRVLGPRVTWFTCGASQVGQDPLARIARAEDLECALHRLKPAQTHLTVGYEGA